MLLELEALLALRDHDFGQSKHGIGPYFRHHHLRLVHTSPILHYRLVQRWLQIVICGLADVTQVQFIGL